MKKIFWPILIIIFIICLFSVFLRIKWFKMFSPGELSFAHADLDLSIDCAACHTKGKQLDNDKCLDCHEEIENKKDLGSGLHGHVSEECVDCHSEHHGRNIDIAYFDQENFDHAKTGWLLEGRHALLKCQACHTRDTFLLNKTECVNCHQDIHNSEYGEDCSECHNQNTFRMD